MLVTNKYTWFTLIITLFSTGKTFPDVVIGRKQIGDAGSLCSFMTTLLVGPGVGLDRNGGYLKTVRDIGSLYGPFSYKNKRHYSNLIGNQIKLENLRETIYAPECVWSGTQNLRLIYFLYSRNELSTTDYYIVKKLLLESNFITLDSYELCDLIYPESLAELKISFREYWNRINLKSVRYPHLAAGNKNFFRRANKLNLLSFNECQTSILKILKLYRYLTDDMLNDCIYFGLINQKQINNLKQELINSTSSDLVLKLEKIHTSGNIQLQFKNATKSKPSSKTGRFQNIGLDARLIALVNSGYKSRSLQTYGRCIVGRIPLAFFASRGYSLNEWILKKGSNTVNNFDYFLDYCQDDKNYAFNLEDKQNEQIFVSYCAQVASINLNVSTTVDSLDLNSKKGTNLIKRIFYKNVEVTLKSVMIPKRLTLLFWKNKSKNEFYSHLYALKSRGHSDE
jgi:hypothetical protein